MLKETVTAYFGTQAAVAITLNISPPAVSAWDEVIPEKQAGRLERLTHGELAFDAALYETDPVEQSKAVA